MASQVRPIHKSRRVSTIHSDHSQGQPTDFVFGLSGVSPLATLTALTVEFVAKPEEAKRAENSIPTALESSLRELEGYAGCLVMISNLEARLITAITFWSGPHGARLCQQNARWVNALLKPYLDRCLRSQTVFARLPLQSGFAASKRHGVPCEAESSAEFESDLQTVA